LHCETEIHKSYISSSGHYLSLDNLCENIKRKERDYDFNYSSGDDGDMVFIGRDEKSSIPLFRGNITEEVEDCFYLSDETNQFVRCTRELMKIKMKKETLKKRKAPKEDLADDLLDSKKRKTSGKENGLSKVLDAHHLKKTSTISTLKKKKNETEQQNNISNDDIYKSGPEEI
jgi:hypothetical protein